MRQSMLDIPLAKNLPPDARMRGRLLNILLVGIAIIASIILAVLVSAKIIGFTQFEPILYTSTLALILGISFIYWLNRQGNIYIAGVLFLFLLTSAITLSDDTYQLVVGRSLVFFIIPIMMASFLIRSYASFVVAVILAIEHLFLWNSNSEELIGIGFSPFGIFAFFVFALITWLAARSLEDALSQTREVNLRLDELVEIRTQALSEANAQLADANERLTELDSLKSKFVSDVSHELRTPISNISIYLEMVEHVLSGIENLPEKTLGFLKILRNETTRLTKLITDVLSTSRLEQSIATIEMQEVDVTEILAEVVEANRLKAESKGINFSLSVSDSRPNLLADPDQLKQVFTNLIANAINYTSKGSVEVSTQVGDGNQFIFRIQDTGMGIASGDIEHLFERFYRGQQASLSSIPGTGLGLAISKEIVEVHKGRIDIQSEINVGTTFTVYFPIYTPENES